MAKAASVVAFATDQTTNDGEGVYDARLPYRATVSITGSAPLLFHRWTNEAVEAKAAAAKGSKAKKTDDIETYVWRNEVGEICLPGEYVRQSIIAAAKYRQDPRSPRKSAMDLVKAGLVSLTECATLGVTDWDYEDRRRVVVQRNAITRTRPAMHPGWEAEFTLLVNLPEYISSTMLRELLNDAGRLIGVGDFRPSYGRYTTTSFRIEEA
jgi:hypothetical protein